MYNIGCLVELVRFEADLMRSINKSPSQLYAKIAKVDLKSSGCSWKSFIVLSQAVLLHNDCTVVTKQNDPEEHGMNMG